MHQADEYLKVDGPTLSSRHKMRPQSQGSTASMHSATTQPNMDTSGFDDVSHMYSGQWTSAQPVRGEDMNGMGQARPRQWIQPGQHGQHGDVNQGQAQVSAETMILHAAPHMQAPNHNYAMNGSMTAPITPPQMDFHLHGLPNGGPAAAMDWGNGDSQLLDRDGDSQLMDHDEDSQLLDRDDGTHGGNRPRKASKPGRSNANNEYEMRNLYQNNRHRSLADVAAELRGDERGPNSERTRQLYAMLWLENACCKGSGSVPRTRVHSAYAERCSDDKVDVLNPASFGKLVRVLFPGLRTRRLGVRGGSKYHYVEFELREKPKSEKHDTPQNGGKNSSTVAAEEFSFNTPPSLDDDKLPPRPTSTAHSQNSCKPSLHSWYNFPHDRWPSSKTSLELSFTTEADLENSETLVLPQIGPFLPAGTDPDVAQSLVALYRSHCISIVESIRFLKEKNFFHLYTSFHGTLTMPVQRLLAHAAIAPWIRICDMVLYQRLIKLLAPLSLQVLPKPVMLTMKSMSEKLVKHIQEAFHGQPEHVIQAKQGPATIFAGLVGRIMRVNLTAHAAANALSNSANRDQMFEDWVNSIHPLKIAECAPSCGQDDVAKLLISEMKGLLDPENLPVGYEDMHEQAECHKETSTQAGGASCLHRWQKFLMDLPAKFPYASPPQIVSGVVVVGSAILQDLAIAQSPSFSSWLVAKTFVEEEIRFLAELGGLLKTNDIQGVGCQQSQPNGGTDV